MEARTGRERATAEQAAARRPRVARPATALAVGALTVALLAAAAVFAAAVHRFGLSDLGQVALWFSFAARLPECGGPRHGPLGPGRHRGPGPVARSPHGGGRRRCRGTAEELPGPGLGPAAGQCRKGWRLAWISGGGWVCGCCSSICDVLAQVVQQQVGQVHAEAVPDQESRL